MALDTVDFVIPLLREERQILDLGNSLMAITGVGAISVDLPSHTVSIEYDPTYLSPTMMRACITGSGYPLAGLP
ncbi:MAG: heavy-metal-associated domain-containing protein [Chloroflexota bacterium]|nr:heavy-metal-associated domain-containing protein [Chloroflexota bacterium]